MIPAVPMTRLESEALEFWVASRSARGRYRRGRGRPNGLDPIVHLMSLAGGASSETVRARAGAALCGMRRGRATLEKLAKGESA